MNGTVQRHWSQGLGLALLLCLASSGSAQTPVIPAHAAYVLPQTHNNQSGYFSLCEGQDGSVYVGTAKYGENGYLVRFDPQTGEQRIVIDIHALCHLSATGFAAQAKIHTRNFVGPSGKIYVGSKQGYRAGTNDTSEYPGGHVMTYDPRTDLAEDLGMPYPGEGVIDTVADESRGLIYAVTCEAQHWMLYDMELKTYRELGPMLTPYATTLVDARGVASAITTNFHLAQYDPDQNVVTVRPIVVDGLPFLRANNSAIPTWILTADATRAYLILMNEPTLIEIDLAGTGEVVKAKAHGRMIEGKNPDSRSALTLSPDGCVYALVHASGTNQLGRFDPRSGRIENMGIPAVSNPDWFDFAPGPDGAVKPWTHGFQTLPDGARSPRYHMGLIAGSDGTLYITAIYPFTLLRIDAFKLPPPDPTPAAQRVIEAILGLCDRTERNLEELTRVAEIAAERHLAGGLIGLHINYQSIAGELHGRSGGLVHIGFDRPFKPERSAAERALDVMIASWDRAPGTTEQAQLEAARKEGTYIIGFGPRDLPALHALIPLCDAFFDTGVGANDSLVTLSDGRQAGRGQPVANTLNGWAFMAEVVGALTRRGKMPPIWKAYLYEDGKAWGDKFFGKVQFDEEYAVAPQPAGALARRFLDQARYHLRRFARTQQTEVQHAAAAIAAELQAGHKTVVATEGHMAWTWAGRGADAMWADGIDIHPTLPWQAEPYREKTPDGALVLRLGYFGREAAMQALADEKSQRLMLITSLDDPRPAFQSPPNTPVVIDLGCAFGDAAVPLEGYPIGILPLSGVMQAAAYEAVAAEVLSRLTAAP